MAVIVFVAFLLWVFVPLGPLDCAAEEWNPTAPDGTNLRICRRPLPFAMPGQGGDAPGVLVMRDGAGFIRGVTTLQIAYVAMGHPLEWTADRVMLMLHADMPRPSPTPFALLADAGWRLRYALGLAPADTSFR